MFTKKNVARLQYLKNELASAKQGELSIPKFFLKIKNICLEISTLDLDEPVSEARMKEYIIRGLNKEYISFVTSIQGWAKEPSLVELENLLTS